MWKNKNYERVVNELDKHFLTHSLDICCTNEYHKIELLPVRVIDLNFMAKYNLGKIFKTFENVFHWQSNVSVNDVMHHLL